MKINLLPPPNLAIKRLISIILILLATLTASAQGEWKWAHYWTGGDGTPDFDTFFSILRIFLIFSTVLRHPKFLFKKRLDLLVPICKE